MLETKTAGEPPAASLFVRPRLSAATLLTAATLLATTTLAAALTATLLTAALTATALLAATLLASALLSTALLGLIRCRLDWSARIFFCFCSHNSLSYRLDCSRPAAAAPTDVSIGSPEDSLLDVTLFFARRSDR